MDDRDSRERERYPPRPSFAWRVREILEVTRAAVATEEVMEPRAETIDRSIIDIEKIHGEHDPWAVRYADFSVCDESCRNQQSKEDEIEKEKLVRDSYKHSYELRTPITNAIAVTDVRLPFDKAVSLLQLLNEEHGCDIKEVIWDGGGIVLRFANVQNSGAFMKFVEGKLGSEGRENCSFRADPKATEEYELERWKKVYVADVRPQRTETLLLVFVGVRYHLVSLDGRRASYVVTEIVFMCGDRVESHKLDPITSQNIVTPGKVRARDNSKAMAILANFLRSLSMKLMSSGFNGCLFLFANSTAGRAFVKWAEALQMLPELCKYVTYVGFNRKTAEKRKVLKDFPNENSVVETSLALGTRMLFQFQTKIPAKDFKKKVLTTCFPTPGIEKRFTEVWGNPGKVAYVDLRFVAGPPGGDPIIIQIGLSIQNSHVDQDQLFCCLPTETTNCAETVTSGQAKFASSEAELLGEFIRFLAASHLSVVLCTVSDYFALSLLVSKVYRHGLDSAFLDVVVGHFDLVAAASESFTPVELSRATLCGIASPASVWEAVFPEAESPWADPQSSPPAHVSARNLGKMVKATVADLTTMEAIRKRAKAMDEFRLGGGDAAVELKITLTARTIRPRHNIQLMALLSPVQESAIQAGQCVVFVSHRRKGQLALTDFKVCESTGTSAGACTTKAISFLATNCTDDALTLAEDELLGFVR